MWSHNKYEQSLFESSLLLKCYKSTKVKQLLSLCLSSCWKLNFLTVTFISNRLNIRFDCFHDQLLNNQDKLQDVTVSERIKLQFIKSHSEIADVCLVNLMMVWRKSHLCIRDLQKALFILTAQRSWSAILRLSVIHSVQPIMISYEAQLVEMAGRNCWSN